MSENAKIESTKINFFLVFFKFFYFLFTWFPLHEVLTSAVEFMLFAIRILEDRHSDPYVKYSDRYYVVVSLSFANNIPRCYLKMGPR